MTAEPLAPAGTTVGLSISGMTCESCAVTLTEALSPLVGVRLVSVDHAAGLAVALLEEGADPEAFAFDADAVIHEAGYTLESASLVAVAAVGEDEGMSGGCGGNCACGSAAADDAPSDDAAAADEVAPAGHGDGGCGGGGCGGCC